MNLHNEIMNLPSNDNEIKEKIKTIDNKVIAYKMGHRDARHQAAELSIKAQKIENFIEEIVKLDDEKNFFDDEDYIQKLFSIIETAKELKRKEEPLNKTKKRNKLKP